MELFPNASDKDIQLVKNLLHRYTRMRSTVLQLSKKEHPTEKEYQVLNEYQKKTESIEMAINLIVDDNVRRVMEFRFIRGNPRWGTVKRFDCVTDRSVDRRIVKGVGLVAETMKLIGAI
ncbi:hypothetical protein [Paenibacillus sp. USHLN196]|uniref:hypothetical protein n=1 Tax=Paenibacillus sp. USHLN196 TaxID=3081291 RepID=UPI0030194727